MPSSVTFLAERRGAVPWNAAFLSWCWGDRTLEHYPIFRTERRGMAPWKIVFLITLRDMKLLIPEKQYIFLIVNTHYRFLKKILFIRKQVIGHRHRGPRLFLTQCVVQAVEFKGELWVLGGVTQVS